MVNISMAAPLPVLPPFALPDQYGARVNTAQLRGRRNLVLLLLPSLDGDTNTYLARFAARREEWAWLHTAVLVVVPETARVRQAGTTYDLPILEDSGAVRTALLPDTEANVAALIVADTTGRVSEFRTARRTSSLPEVDTVFAWAWEVARPRGACDGGVAWARPTVVGEPPPVPIGTFTIGARRTDRRRYRSMRSATRGACEG